MTHFGCDTVIRVLDAGILRDVVTIKRERNADGTWGDGFYEIGEGFTAEDALREIAKNWPWDTLMSVSR